MRPKRLYYRTDSNAVSKWKCANCAILWLSARSSITAALHSACAWQPALSRQIQNLENEIGLELFERLPRRVKITDAGKFFLNAARHTLQDVNDATACAKRIASGESGALAYPDNELSS